MKRNPEMGKLSYSLYLPKQPIYPFPDYVSGLHPVHVVFTENGK